MIPCAVFPAAINAIARQWGTRGACLLRLSAAVEPGPVRIAGSGGSSR